LVAVKARWHVLTSNKANLRVFGVQDAVSTVQYATIWTFYRHERKVGAHSTLEHLVQDWHEALLGVCIDHSMFWNASKRPVLMITTEQNRWL
jgi:hypothetical protein